MSQNKRMTGHIRENEGKNMSSSAEMYGIMQPTKGTDGTYTWNGIAIAPWTNGQSKLVVTADELLPGTLIPILGTLINKGEITGPRTHAYQNAHLSRFVVDGHPSTDPYKGIGNKGLSIAMMANEPSKTSQATATFTHDYLRILKRLVKGDEITVIYARSKAMREMRKRHGYTVTEDKDPVIQPSAYSDPGQEVRRYYTAKWYTDVSKQPSTRNEKSAPHRTIRGYPI